MDNENVVLEPYLFPDVNYKCAHYAVVSEYAHMATFQRSLIQRSKGNQNAPAIFTRCLFVSHCSTVYYNMANNYAK